MLILVINLARRPDRLALMRGQLDALGLEFERVDAVDGKAADLGPGTDLITPIERACAFSHRRAWARFLESGESHCLVMEDDVLVSPHAGKLVENLNRLPGNAEIVRLETGLQVSLIGHGHDFGLAGHRAHRLYSRQHGAAAYIVSRVFAQRAVRDLKAFAEPIDDVLFQVKSPNFFPSVRYQISPGLCIQADLYEPTQRSGLARSDLQVDRANRVYGAMAPKIKVKRSLPEKCVREAGRWWRRVRGTTTALFNLVVLGRALRHIPFTGTVTPAAAAAFPPAPSPHPGARAM